MCVQQEFRLPKTLVIFQPYTMSILGLLEKRLSASFPSYQDKIWWTPLFILRNSSIEHEKISGIRPDFFQLSGKSGIRPDSKKHYPGTPSSVDCVVVGVLIQWKILQWESVRRSFRLVLFSPTSNISTSRSIAFHLTSIRCCHVLWQAFWLDL